jgi:hypothetical protein
MKKLIQSYTLSFLESRREVSTGLSYYSIYTADLPETAQTTLATYADDTTILASHKNPNEASGMLQIT